MMVPLKWTSITTWVNILNNTVYNSILFKFLKIVNQGYVTEFRYCQKIGWGIQDYGQLGTTRFISLKLYFTFL